MKALLPLLLLLSLGVHAKTFKNSYISFEVPDDWVCTQEGPVWSCAPHGINESKQALIVLAAKVAGPEDNMGTFLNFLKQPKKILTKVGTPMPSKVMYAQRRQLGGQEWVQAQHYSSEVEDFYTLYLATVKQKLAMLASFTVDRQHYQQYNPIFDKAIRSLKIVANQQLLFPPAGANGGGLGIQVPGAGGNMTPFEDVLPPPQHGTSGTKMAIILLVLAALIAGAAYMFKTRRKKISSKVSSSGKTNKPRTKS